MLEMFGPATLQSLMIRTATRRVGDKKNAIKYWEMAIKNIPENQKQFYTPMFEEELKKAKSM